LETNWQKQRQNILSSISKHDQSYLDEANAMQVKLKFVKIDFFKNIIDLD